ncbi:metallophosphoesterase [bacterium]|nr:metallophosphoesterase [bacterium]
MPRLSFVTDLHGHPNRYDKLFEYLIQSPPDMLLLGGDLCPHGFHSINGDFFADIFLAGFERVRAALGNRYPKVHLILGNDDGASIEPWFIENGAGGLWTYLHMQVVEEMGLTLIGYNYVPPTPFMLKDWEKYDVSRYVDPGCVSPEEGQHSISVRQRDLRYSTIAQDLSELTESVEMENAVLLAHSPPYKTALDHAGLEGKMVDHVPLDSHVGSIAIRRWIESRQPLLTLHGHIHESTSRTGDFKEQLGRTWMINGATGGPELVVVEIDTDNPADAARLTL